jgi:hypothetical protein
MSDNEPTREELIMVLLQRPWVRGVDADNYTVFWNHVEDLLNRVDPATLDRLARQARTRPLDRHPRGPARVTVR